MIETGARIGIERRFHRRFHRRMSRLYVKARMGEISSVWDTATDVTDSSNY